MAKSVSVKSILESLITERKAYRLSGAESNKLTKECLQKALVVLMGEKPFAKITITEIVFRSGVSRQSFYRNYSSKEDVLKDLAKNFFNTFKSLIKDKENQPQVEFYKSIYSYLLDYKKEMVIISKAQFSPSEENIFLDELKDCYTNLNTTQFYAIYSFLGGIISVIKQWIQHGMTESAEEMAELSAKIFGSQYKLVLETVNL
jgi:AcrR family transcriptional regulator